MLRVAIIILLLILIGNINDSLAMGLTAYIVISSTTTYIIRRRNSENE